MGDQFIAKPLYHRTTGNTTGWLCFVIMNTELAVVCPLLARTLIKIPIDKEEICRYSSQYSTRLSEHPNSLVVNLMGQPDNNRRLRRHLPNDLPTIFLV
jgi:hypothetical protein